MFKIVSLNVNSISTASRRTLLTDFIAIHDMDVLLLQETKLGGASKLFVPNYNIFRMDLGLGRCGNAILIKKTHRVRNVNCPSKSIHYIAAEVMMNNEWMRIVSVYAPHNLRNPDTAFDKIFANKTPTILGGDFNARLREFGDDSENTYGRSLRAAALRGNHHIHNPERPTCFHNIHGSFIDKFVTYNVPGSHAVTVLGAFSDHDAVQMTLPSTASDTLMSAEPRRAFNRTKIGKANRFIGREFNNLQMPTYPTLRDGDCEHIAVQIDQILGTAVAKFVPAARGRENFTLSSTVRALQRECKKLQRQRFRLRHNLTWNETCNLHTRIGLLKNMIHNRAKCEFAAHFTDKYNAVKTIGEAHHTIRGFTSHKSRPAFSGSLRTGPNLSNIIAGDGAIAEHLADKFESNHTITHQWDSVLDTRANITHNKFKQYNDFIQFCPRSPANALTREDVVANEEGLRAEKRGLLTSTEEIREILCARPSKSSSGYDGVPYVFLKTLDDHNVHFIATFFNHLIATAYFPRA